MGATSLSLPSMLLAVVAAAPAFAAERYQPADRLRIVIPSSPDISPDGRSVALLASRANTKDNRWDPELLIVDVASGAQRPVAFDRRALASPRWSPDGGRLAFLANASSDKDA